MDVRWVGVPAVAVLGAVLLAGCGSGAAALSAPTAAELHTQVAAVRASVQSGNRAAAAKGIATLRSTIQRLSASGDLAPSDGAVLLTQVDGIAAGMDAQPTPTPTPTPKPTATPPPVRVIRVPVPAAHDGHDKAGHGKGKGHKE